MSISGKKLYILLSAAIVLLVFAAGQLIAFVNTPDAGFIDKTGKLKIALPGLLDGGEFRDGLSPAESARGWGFINTQGQWVIPPQFKKAQNFSEGVAAVCLENERVFAYIDKTAHAILEVEASRVGDFHDGVAMIVKGGRCGYINKSGEYVIPLNYSPPQNAQTLDSSQGVIAVNFSNPKQKLEYHYIEHSGRWLFDSTFLNAKEFAEELAPVRVDTGWGFVNKSGKLVIAAKYLDANSFSNGLSCVAVSKLPANQSSYIYTYINHKQEQLALEAIQAEPFSEGLAAVKMLVRGKTGSDSEFGYIDASGKWVIKPRFYKARKFSEGLAFTSRRPISRWCWQEY